MFKVKHVLIFSESFLDLLVRPVDKELVIEVCFFSQAT